MTALPHALVAALLLAALPAPAQTYPSRPIRIIVSSAPSSGPDIMARLAGRRLTEAWGQQVVVDNRAGAGGNVGAEIAARAAPDGHTLLMATANHAIAATLYPKLGYDLLRDFAPVGLVAVTPYLLAVHPGVPAASVQELVALAKARPGALNYGSGGSGSPPHLCAEIFRSMTGIAITHVPYKGVTPALTDLAGGQVQLVFSVVPALLPLVRSDKVRALGISSAQRSALVPGLPTIAEAVPGFEVLGWYGVLAPAGTPAGIVARLNAELAVALKSADLQERLAAQGADPQGSTPAELGALLKVEIARWGAAVRASGARVD